jgi:hypothetical protein
MFGSGWMWLIKEDEIDGRFRGFLCHRM